MPLIISVHTLQCSQAGTARSRAVVLVQSIVHAALKQHSFPSKVYLEILLLCKVRFANPLWRHGAVLWCSPEESPPYDFVFVQQVQ